jgi:hypothetical protein
MQKGRAKPPKAKEEGRMMNAEREPKPGTCVVQARYKPCAWEGIGRCKPGTCEVYARYMGGTCVGQAGVLRQCPNGSGRDRMPRTVSICRLCRQLRTLLTGYSPRWGMRIVPAPRVIPLAGCSWRAAGEPTKQEGRPNNEPPFTNPQPRVPQPILVRQPVPECIQTWRPLVCIKAARHRAAPHQGLKLTR